MEEGEIVRVSPVSGVMKGCDSIMAEVLHQLHTASQHHLSPVGVGGGGAMDFAVSLQLWLEELCELLIAPDQMSTWYVSHTTHVNDTERQLLLSAQWLEEVIVCVCTCTSELQAARTLSYLLTSATISDKVSRTYNPHCGLTQSFFIQVLQFLSLYWRLQSRHPTVAMTTIGMTIIHHKEQLLAFTRTATIILSLSQSNSHCRQITLVTCAVCVYHDLLAHL